MINDDDVVVTPTTGDEGLIITGVDGGFGCSVGSAGGSRVDPSLPLLLLLSLGGLFYSRRANGREVRVSRHSN